MRTMETIVKNKYYEIHYDEKKNRVYYKVTGFWENIDIVPNYTNDIKSVAKFVKPNYTMLVDTRNLEVHPQDVEELRIWAQEEAVKMGMFKAAQIVSEDFISELQFDDMTERANFLKGKFSNFEEAEAWLDKISDEIK
jgi:hypothetical protein